MRIGLVAGEASGDILGAGLIRELKKRVPNARFFGVAGPLMAAEGCEVWAESETLAVMGLVEPLKVLPELLRLRRDLLERWSAQRPHAFVGIDAPEFNLGLARRLRHRGIRTVQYVSPQLWAWRQGRVRTIGRAVNQVLCLLPFEKDFYDRFGVAANVVGHPLADNLPSDLRRDAVRQELGLDAGRVVAVLPGSRSGEVERLGPVFAATARQILAEDASVSFVAPMANPAARSGFERCLSAEGVEEQFMLTDGGATEAIVAADVVLLASGTASLQTALLKRPMVSAYRVASLTYHLAQLFRLLKVPHFTMPNLLTDEPLVPEFLQDAATPDALAGALLALMNDEGRRHHIETTFAELRVRLALGADQRAAAAVETLAAEAQYA